eukprot:TRINITY_DN1980_c0_g1_i1.p1 TRINITY_DN1980_c0_g1~~TRINITY_DN1980_c0_g1_i1.p1  ORF type:complete len:460 (-),score=60.75 TRINITY_DN1980_c0_g1_i1:865-2244(-)
MSTSPLPKRNHSSFSTKKKSKPSSQHWITPWNILLIIALCVQIYLFGGFRRSGGAIEAETWMPRRGAYGDGDRQGRDEDGRWSDRHVLAAESFTSLLDKPGVTLPKDPLLGSLSGAQELQDSKLLETTTGGGVLSEDRGSALNRLQQATSPRKKALALGENGDSSGSLQDSGGHASELTEEEPKTHESAYATEEEMQAIAAEEATKKKVKTPRSKAPRTTRKKSVLSREGFTSECVLESVGGHGADTYGAWSLCGNRLRKGGIVYSFGLGSDVSFDNALVEKGLEVYGFDPTITEDHVKSVFNTKHAKQEIPTSFHFRQLGLGSFDGAVTFAQSRNAKIESKTAVALSELKANYRTGGTQAAILRFQTFMCMLEHEWVDVLKMDVEGVEFDICLSADFRSKVIRADQILIEFHERLVRDGNTKKAQCEELLKEKGYRLVYQSKSKQEMAFARIRPPSAS